LARNYKNLQIYHLGYDFVLSIYKVTNDFPESEKTNITSQLRRASVSIILNIAEGCTRSSTKEFFHYLTVSYGSAKEVEVLIQLCYDLGYLNKENHFLLSTKIDELNSKIFLFIRQIEEKIQGKKHYFYQKFEEEK